MALKERVGDTQGYRRGVKLERLATTLKVGYSYLC
jgi:hypothetical protein